jgi:adenylosuccinate synthase
LKRTLVYYFWGLNKRVLNAVDLIIGLSWISICTSRSLLYTAINTDDFEEIVPEIAHIDNWAQVACNLFSTEEKEQNKKYLNTLKVIKNVNTNLFTFY